MKQRRIWVLGIGSVLAAFLFIACGGGATTTSVPTSPPTQVPSGTVSPTAQADKDSEATTTPESTQVPAATASPTPQAANDAEAKPASATGYTWQVDTVDGNGAKPSLAVDAKGVPHIAYMLEAMSGFVKYAIAGGDGWDISTISTGYLYGPLDIQVNQQGVPQVSWHSHDEEDAGYAVLVDGKWDVQYIQDPGHDGWDNNLAIDSTGQPHVVSIDPVQFGGSSGVEYATFDGNSWTVEEVGSGPIRYEFGTFVAVDSQDRPHVVWFDSNDQDLKYAVKDGGSWQVSTVDSDGDVGRYPSLAVDSQDNPAISYFEPTSESAGYVKVARWDGSQWNIQRVDQLESVFTGFFGARKTSSLVFDRDDNPIVAYSDEAIIKVAIWDGSNWITDTVLTADGDPLGQQVSVAMDIDGVLHLTFADVTRKSSPGVTGSIKYARGTTGARAAADGQPSSEVSSQPAAASSSSVSLVEPDPDFEQGLFTARFPKRGWKTDFSLHTVPFSEIFSGGVGRDGIPSIDNPKFTTPELADEWLGELEPVIAFELNEDAKAYPLQILTWHEIVNDEVGGVPVVVTFCPLCNSAIVFERTLDGVVHTFGVSGNLRNSDLIMWDRQTETWWQQITGEGIVGEQAGKRLTFLPAPIISWGAFKDANPDGKVLSRDTGFRRDYGRNPYVGYDRIDTPPFLFRGDLDGRLQPKERVVTVTVGDVDAAFPFSILAKEKVVNYNVGGQDLAVFFKPGTRSVLDLSLMNMSKEIGATGLFDAELDGRKLIFRADGDDFIDNETGSSWNILGEAIKGPSTGKKLTPIAHTNSFWFAVAAFKPDIQIYQGAS